MTFKKSVIANKTKPKAKADKVSGELNSKSPTRAFTMLTVTVVMSCKGLKERFALNSAAMTTIMVSPKAFERANKQAEIMPGSAVGSTMSCTTSPFVKPSPKAAFF